MGPIQLTDDQRFQVLLAQLQERYGASHNMRERGTQFALWISGMGIGLAWLLISQSEMTIVQRMALTLLIVALSIGSFIFIRGLQKGFNNNRDAMICCERALRMYEMGAYAPECSLLPSSYGVPHRRWSDHFNTLIVWLSIVIVSLAVLTWTCPQASPECSLAMQTQIEKEKK